MHVNGHKCHIAYLALWNTKQLPAFNGEEKQSSVSIPLHNLLFHLAADFGKKKQTELIWCLSSQDQPTSFLEQEEQVNRTQDTCHFYDFNYLVYSMASPRTTVTDSSNVISSAEKWRWQNLLRHFGIGTPSVEKSLLQRTVFLALWVNL